MQHKLVGSILQLTKMILNEGTVTQQKYWRRHTDIIYVKSK